MRRCRLCGAGRERKSLHAELLFDLRGHVCVGGLEDLFFLRTVLRGLFFRTVLRVQAGTLGWCLGTVVGSFLKKSIFF
jgi:hypothetical protein